MLFFCKCVAILQAEDGELTFDPGDIITNIDQIDEVNLLQYSYVVSLSIHKGMVDWRFQRTKRLVPCKLC